MRMKNKHLLHLLLLCTALTGMPALTYAQTDAKPSREIRSVIKTENDKYGFINESVKQWKEWFVKPVYNKITAIDFGGKQFPLYYKCWKDSTYDIARYFRSAASPFYKFNVVATDVTEIQVKDEATMKNFFAYKSNGKWGCFIYWDRPYDSYDYKTVKAEYAQPPVLSKFQDNDNYVLVQTAAGTGLLDNQGNRLIEPGHYKNAADKLVITQGAGNLKGYTIGAAVSVDPKYTSIEETGKTNDNSYSYVIGTLPDGSREVRVGNLLLPPDQAAVIIKNVNQQQTNTAALTRKTLHQFIEAEFREDGSGRILQVNGKPVNFAFRKMDGYYDFFTQGIDIFYGEKETKMYFNAGTSAVEFHYDLLPAENYIRLQMSNAPWPGEKMAVPTVLTDSANTLVLVNGLNGKRMALPFRFKNYAVEFRNNLYSLVKFNNPADIRFERSDSSRCTLCKGVGYISETKTEKVEGKVSYKTVKNTSKKVEQERVWNPATNSYEWVKTTRPVTTTETVEVKEPDSQREVVVQKKCVKCKGRGFNSYREYIQWNGNAFVLSGLE